MVAKTTLPQLGLQRRWTALPGEELSDGANPYIGYDRFGRTQRSLWLKDTGIQLQPLVDVAWGYGQASLRTWRTDRSPEEHQDQHFSYDELYQLTQPHQGQLQRQSDLSQRLRQGSRSLHLRSKGKLEHPPN